MSERWRRNNCKDIDREGHSDACRDVGRYAFGMDLRSFGDREEFVDEDERRAWFLLVADDYKWWSKYGQIAETYFAFVLMTCVTVAKAILRYGSKEISAQISFISEM